MFKEDQVCNPDQAKILSEAGILQDSVWFWNKHDDGTWHLHHNRYSFEVYSAFTGMELGLMLPLCMLTTKTYYKPDPTVKDGLLMYRVQGELVSNIPSDKIVRYENRIARNFTPGYSVHTGAPTEAQARAQMVIYLLKMEIIPFQHFNKTLYLSKE